LLLSGKAVRFTPDQAYLKKMFEKMKTSGSMPKMQAGVPTGANGMTQTMPAGQTPQGVSSQAAVLSTMNNDPATKTIWVKDEKTGLRPNVIKIGIDNGTSVEILSGLKEGDDVVISIGDKDVKTSTKKTDNGPPGFPF
jgi:HlyD family secretion protein